MTVIHGLNRRIKDALVSILSGLTYGGEPAFVSVLDNTHAEFSGSPVARVLPDGYKSVTGSNYQKDHTVSFSIIISWPLEDPSDVEADLYNAMYDLTDVVVNALELGDHAGQLTTVDPTIQDWKMDVTKAAWRLAAGKTGALLLDEIIVEVTYSQDVA
jgi:hypothetical protein